MNEQGSDGGNTTRPGVEDLPGARGGGGEDERNREGEAQARGVMRQSAAWVLQSWVHMLIYKAGGLPIVQGEDVENLGRMLRALGVEEVVAREEG